MIYISQGKLWFLRNRLNKFQGLIEPVNDLPVKIIIK